MGAPGTFASETDNTYVPYSEEGMTLAYVGISERGPTTEADGAPVTLASDADVDRYLGSNSATWLSASYLKYVLSQGGRIKYARAVASGTKATLSLLDAGAAACLRIDATSPGVWAHNVTVQVADDESDPVNYFKLIVSYTTQPELGDTYYRLSMDPTNAQYVQYILNGVSLLIAATPLTANRPANIAATALAGGAVSDAPTPSNFQSQFALFDGEFDLTHMTTQSLLAETWSYGAAYLDPDIVAGARADLLWIQSMPLFLTSTQAQLYRNGGAGYGYSDVDSSYTALYWGDPKMRLFGSPAPQSSVSLPYMLGTYARKMANSYPWLENAGLGQGKAPGGVIPGALGVYENVLGKSVHDTLSDAQINPVVWDSAARKAYINDIHTCQKAVSARQFVGVRELLNYVKRAWRYEAKRVQFDPNHPRSWRDLYQAMKLKLDPIGSDEQMGLDGPEGSGWAYVGDQQYVRRQDATFNTQNDLIAGNYRARLYIVPINAMRRLYLDVTLTKSSAEFEEGTE